MNRQPVNALAFERSLTEGVPAARRRAGQGIERFGAAQAFVTQQSPCHAVTMDVPRRAMRAFQIGPKPAVDQLLRLCPGAPLAQRINQLPHLGGGQITDKF